MSGLARKRDYAESGPIGSFLLFEGDAFARALAQLGMGPRNRQAVPLRILFFFCITWLPLYLLSLLEGHDLGPTPRESFLMDLATYAQFVGFFPLAIVAEAMIGQKMVAACRHLSLVAEPQALLPLMRRAERRSHMLVVDVLALGLSFFFTSLWACSELSNSMPSWHTQPGVSPGLVASCVSGTCALLSVAGKVGERFTYAGWWAAFFALPLFTYLWLRWVWKIAVWTGFLFQVSRLKLNLVPTHPDRTGGLGALTDVQKSFGLILFGTGLLFSTATWYKVAMEGTPVSSYTVWLPVIVYVLLAPSVFLAPLFMFTRQLSRTKADGLFQFGKVAIELSQRYEQRWLRAPDADRETMLSDPQTSSLADFRTNYDTVREMRVVPFDAKSIKELFVSAAGPFLPTLLDFIEMPEKVKDFLKMWL